MKAVILAAGEGTRLRPVTYYIPKPMLPFYGKPFMAYTIENLSGLVDGVIIVVNHKEKQIRDYFGDQYASLPIEYVKQQDLHGTGSAVIAARELLNRKFLVIHGDVYASRELLTDIVAIDSEFCLSLTRVDDPENHAGVIYESELVKQTLVFSPWVDFGVWLLSPIIFNYIQGNDSSKDIRELRILAVIQKLINDNLEVNFHMVYDPWIELGDHESLESVLKALAFFRKKLGQEDSYIASEVYIENSEIKNSLIFGKGKVIDSRIESSMVYLQGIARNQNISGCIAVTGSI